MLHPYALEEVSLLIVARPPIKGKLIHTVAWELEFAKYSSDSEQKRLQYPL